MRHARLIFLLWTAAIAAVFLYAGRQSVTVTTNSTSSDGAQLDQLLHEIADQTVYEKTNDCGRLAIEGMTRLRNAGYTARIIDVVTLGARDNLNDGHLLNEVFNPHSAAWEVVDFSLDRWYRQTAWSFVQSRSDFERLTPAPARAAYPDPFHVFRDPEAFYNHVAQAVAIEDRDGVFWFGNAAHQQELNAYGYRFDPDFLSHFYLSMREAA